MITTPIDMALAGSFRDPSGFVFQREGVLYRQIQQSYRRHFEHLMSSGLYADLVENGLLVSHEDAEIRGDDSPEFYKSIKPVRVPFVSYPYEWSFSQLKSAAQATLEIQKRALRYGMTLVDGSAYNIQFLKNRPILIDTLSFRKYEEGEPWTAYRQFCQHFLAPLALMSLRDVRLGQLIRLHIDGIHLDLASLLLPTSSRFKLPLFLHIHLHSRSQRKYAHKTVGVKGRKLNRRSFLGLIDSLESAVRRLSWDPRGTEWGDYYRDTNYSPEGMEHKTAVVEGFLKECRPNIVWDLGGNVGDFSRIAARTGALTISIDNDPACVEQNYVRCLRENEENILPLLSDLTNPSPGIGWENAERAPLLERGPADAVMALALVHHLAISNNVPLDRIARFFGRLGRSLIIEFVPKEDSQVQRLLATREDIFGHYDRPSFESAFRRFFIIRRTEAIRDSRRVLYLMERA